MCPPDAPITPVYPESGVVGIYTPPIPVPMPFNYDEASPVELMDEIIRITVTDYRELSQKILHPPIPEAEREAVYEMMDKYASNMRLVDIYLDKLQEIYKEPGMIEKELEKRQRELANINNAN